MKIQPYKGKANLVIKLNKVDLPVPLAPTKATTDPGEIKYEKLLYILCYL